MNRYETTFRATRHNVVSVAALCCGATVLPIVVASPAESAPVEDTLIQFDRDIRPLLAQKCLLCHGPDEAEGGLRLDSRHSTLSDLDSGQRAVVPGDLERSDLLRRVTTTDEGERMPPDGERLTMEEIARLRRWITEGAPWDVHWAYQPISSAPPPSVQNQAWVRNAIDRYVLARLEAAGVEPSPEADRSTLIKRLYYDLVGLPPDPADVDAFASDESPNAYQRLVDRLLASPHFGERWGRHWLDKARYADSDGYEKDNVRKDAWRYRDWVIDAINADMPYDQFTIRQLAGDLLPDAKPSDLLATAFNRQTLTNTEGGTDQEQWRVAAVMDRTETLGTVWLGLTVGCCRCHSHKYDQLTQDEYYQLYAYFNNGDETNTDVVISDTALAKYKDAQLQHERELQQLKAQLETAHGGDSNKAEHLQQQLAELEKKAPKAPTMSVRTIRERANNRRITHVLRRGDFREPLDEVQPETPAVLPPIQPRDGGTGTDRLDLARWLVDSRNPLTSRVAVNHIWQNLFGEGFVRTPNDFGVRGDRPTHPDLLDYLADQLIRRAWSRKALIRHIAMSSTYRLSSKHRPELADIDPTNRLLYRQNRYRVEAEIIRDLALASSGLLLSKTGGPSVFPPIPESVTDLTYNSSFKWTTSTGGDQYRRGVYTFFKRTAPHPNLITFDCPDSNVTNVRRNRSNTPIGALVTLNNPVYVEAAQAMQRRVLTERPTSDVARMTYAYRLCVARCPASEEVDRLMRLLQANRSWYREHEAEAKQLVGDYAVGDTPIAESAAWIATVRLIMNLDEFITRE